MRRRGNPPKKSALPPPARGLYTDPYTGEVDTLEGWAKRHRIAAPTVKQYVSLYSWDDYFTFYPLVQRRRRR